MSAGETVSVRMPPGAVAELKAATGVPFSTLCRTVLMAYLERLRMERRASEGRIAEQRLRNELREEVDKQIDQQKEA